MKEDEISIVNLHRSPTKTAEFQDTSGQHLFSFEYVLVGTLTSSTYIYLQINTIRQSITQLLFYVQWYICQGELFRPSRSSSGPPRKQIEELFSLSVLWDPKCSQVSFTVYRL